MKEEKRPDTYTSVMKKGIDWLIESDIWIKDPESPYYGAFCSFYDLRKKSYPLLYCEITAYAIKFLLNLYRLENNEKYLNMATASGDFLLKSQNSKHNSTCYGAFPYGYKIPAFMKIKAYYSFDVGICMSALIDLYHICKDSKYLESSRKAGIWLIKNMQNEDGSFKSVSFEDDFQNTYHYPSSIAAIDRCCLHAKNAIGLLKLSEVGEFEFFGESAKKLLNWALQLQNPDGSFKVTADDNYIFTHYHCYCIEGLLYGFQMFQDNRFIQSALKGAQWLLSAQNRDGSLFKSYKWASRAYLSSNEHYKTLKQFIRPKDIGVTAQAVRIWIGLSKYNKKDDFSRAAEKGARFIQSMQCKDDENLNSFGGFYSSCYKLFGFSKLSFQLYPWTTMFACQALHLLSDKEMDKTSFFKELF